MLYTAAIITVSDKGSRGERIDTAGPALAKILISAGYEILHTAIVPDEFFDIQREIVRSADSYKANLILTTGGTGFSPRDITPEVTKFVIERETPGLAELMRSESMKITLHGCLSRSVAGIRGRSLIVNLPGSEKGARENLEAILKPIGHGIKMLLSEGSAECASSFSDKEAKQNVSSICKDDVNSSTNVCTQIAKIKVSSVCKDNSDPAPKINCKNANAEAPSLDAWLIEAQEDASASQCGMYLQHVGVVRETAKKVVRQSESCEKVLGMEFAFDSQKVEAAIKQAKNLPGIYYVKVWLAQGELKVGDKIMQVLIGGDIRPHVVSALESLVSELKNNCITEKEMF
ncbi:MAG: MogA/MoaB family molybdenum cofactor biosynthesis protein [Phascolarctobacterium sp.]|nr:MogA/MoaB family molybdenum cofactor biosynthesis protein [Phascolarctobacterium sp.]